MTGFGFDDKTIATDENGSPVEFSFGGGAAMAIGFGYNIAYGFELELALGYQSTPYYDSKDDFLEEGFHRVIVTFIQKGRLKLSRRGYLKGGLGAGWFGNPQLVYKKSPNILYIDKMAGHEYVFKYNPQAGFLGTVEYEHYMTDRISLSIGLKYYWIKYKLQSITRDGAWFSIGTFSYDFQQAFRKVTGNGVDIILAGAVHF